MNRLLAFVIIIMMALSRLYKAGMRAEQVEVRLTDLTFGLDSAADSRLPSRVYNC